jgi:hypothetical protein
LFWRWNDSGEHLHSLIRVVAADERLMVCMIYRRTL